MNEFEILENQAKEISKLLPELEFKTIATLTLIMGWLITVERTQDFIANNAVVSQ